MRNLLITAALLLTTTGTAMADRHNDGRSGRRETVVRDNRGTSRGNYSNRGRETVVRRDYGRGDYGRRDYGRREVVTRDYGRFGGYRGDFRYHDRRPVYFNNGRYTFNGGYSYNYVRPTYYGHYRNFRVRPTLLIENVDSIPGYVWVRGSWTWDGAEWQWAPGHYIVDSGYVYDGY
jgi:hypothetical protein